MLYGRVRVNDGRGLLRTVCLAKDDSFVARGLPPGSCAVYFQPESHGVKDQEGSAEFTSV